MNHGQDIPAYGLWSLVIIDSAFFLFFAFTFFKPKTKRDWRTFGTFSAFIVALFVEMYGFPLTIYLLLPWLTRRFPGVDPLGHDFGHLWSTLLGFQGNPHWNPIHIASNLVIFGGFVLLSSAWTVLYRAQRTGTLATSGAYAYVRHPQYVAFVLIMFGFLLQWPTLVTLILFPLLLVTYIRLARREEAEVRATFGDEWDRYAARTPPFIPALPGSLVDVSHHRGVHP
ncbi:MAG TPA: isoprenylcysteine carboxylmethyltransferase family protein [Vicinamibacterales bacterium]|nr:isoprenylcysteine carboxylmethyltransferase family protein [Vicinamibacterales bacterium]